MKQLIILAGGKGTRLKERLHNIPKPLVDVCGKPLLEHQLLLAKEHGFTDVIITIHHQADTIREFCGNGSRWSLNISYLEETVPLGTAGALLTELDRLADTFLVMYGDTLLHVDLTRFWEFHAKHHADASIFLHPNDHPHDSDLVEIDAQSRILAFHPYPHPDDRYFQNLANASLYVINKSALRAFQDLAIPEKGVDFAKHLFPLMLNQKQFLLGYNSTEYIKDVGTPKRIDQVNADLRSGKIARRSLKNANGALFIDRDGTLTEQTDYVTSPQQLTLIPGAAEGIKQINQSGYFAILATNQPVVARGDCTEETLQQIHNKLETLLGQEGAYLDAIYACPHHPDKGFLGERADLKIACDCRKPNIGMIKQAQAFTHIDLKQSWFIGDSTVDMQTAKNAGIKSLLVRTGVSGCDDKYAARPDFECYSLSEAIHFILNVFPLRFQQAQKQSELIRPGDKVVIGGLARSGKSTWASLVKLALAERNIPCVIISLDGWIKDIDQRGEGDVFSRHDIDGIKTFIASLENITTEIEIAIPSYNRLQRKRNKQVEKVVISPNHVIFYEGVSAFLLDDLLKNAHHHFYVNATDTMRRENFKKEYALRQLQEDDINALYQLREQDETPLIRATLSTQPAILINDA